MFRDFREIELFLQIIHCLALLVNLLIQQIFPLLFPLFCDSWPCIIFFIYLSTGENILVLVSLLNSRMSDIYISYLRYTTHLHQHARTVFFILSLVPKINTSSNSRAHTQTHTMLHLPTCLILISLPSHAHLTYIYVDTQL